MTLMRILYEHEQLTRPFTVLVQIAGSLVWKSTKEDVSSISLMFDDKVTITEHYVPEFSISTFVANLGGSLGLWLGVGAVQIFGTGVDIMLWIRTKLFN